MLLLQEIIVSYVFTLYVTVKLCYLDFGRITKKFLTSLHYIRGLHDRGRLAHKNTKNIRGPVYVTVKLCYQEFCRITEN